MTDVTVERGKEYRVAAEVSDYLLYNFDLDGPTRAAVRCGLMTASEFNHPTVGSEHLIFGLLFMDEQAEKLFGKYQMTAYKYSAGIEFVVGAGERPVEVGNITPRAYRAMQIAHQTAEQHNQLPVRTTHLLIGLLLAGLEDVSIGEHYGGVGVGILESMGVNLAKLAMNLTSQVAPTL